MKNLIKIIQQAREIVAQLIDMQPTMLLYDLGGTEERSDEELLMSDLEAISGRLTRIAKDNDEYVFKIVDEIMSKYGIDKLEGVEPFKVPLLGKKGSMVDWIGSKDFLRTDPLPPPAGPSFNWVPWDDRNSKPEIKASLSAAGYSRWMTTKCNYCTKEHHYYSDLSFSPEFYKMVLQKDGWVKSDGDHYVCSLCWPDLFGDDA